jgi:beta-lactam-binding protein with PASTA domain
MVAALVLVAVLAFAFFHWITFITHHGDEITVPNLANLTPEQIEDKLSELDLDYEIIDTVDYNPAFQKLTIVQQEPTAGSKVKGGRTIYIKLNAATFTMVAVPDLIEKTYRQAVPTLKSIGLLEGEITYVPYIGKDMVRKMMMNGKEIKPGTKVLKSSKIDLVLGDGKVVFDSTEIDSLIQNENQVDTLTNAE